MLYASWVKQADVVCMLYPMPCQECGKIAPAALVSSATQVRLYGVKAGRYGAKNVIVCTVCRSHAPVDTDARTFFTDIHLRDYRIETPTFDLLETTWKGRQRAIEVYQGARQFVHDNPGVYVAPVTLREGHAAALEAAVVVLAAAELNAHPYEGHQFYVIERPSRLHQWQTDATRRDGSREDLPPLHPREAGLAGRQASPFDATPVPTAPDAAVDGQLAAAANEAPPAVTGLGEGIVDLQLLRLQRQGLLSSDDISLLARLVRQGHARQERPEEAEHVDPVAHLWDPAYQREADPGYG